MVTSWVDCEDGRPDHGQSRQASTVRASPGARDPCARGGHGCLDDHRDLDGHWAGVEGSVGDPGDPRCQGGHPEAGCLGGRQDAVPRVELQGPSTLSPCREASSSFLSAFGCRTRPLQLPSPVEGSLPGWKSPGRLALGFCKSAAPGRP